MTNWEQENKSQRNKRTRKSGPKFMTHNSVDCALAARHKSQSNLLACSTHTELLCLVELLFFVPLMTNFIGPDTYPFQLGRKPHMPILRLSICTLFFYHQIWIHFFKFQIHRLDLEKLKFLVFLTLLFVNFHGFLR